MEINEFVEQLKNKYGYSDELKELLKKAIPAIITYYGENKKQIIFDTLNECEIHIQQENENLDQYLNQYFGVNRKWDIPLVAGALQHTELSINNGEVSSKNIICMRTMYLRQYKPIDFNNDKTVSGLIHEICHAIKGHGKIGIEDGKVFTSTGLSKDYYEYNNETNTFTNNKSSSTGFEEALNSYDEASIMTIMTGEYHEFGAYKGMTEAARKILKNKELAKAIMFSQFSGKDEWKEFLGQEKSEFLLKNFEDWIEVMYSSPKELMDNKENIMKKMNTAKDNILEFIKIQESSKESKVFENNNQTTSNIKIYYDKTTNTFQTQKEKNNEELNTMLEELDNIKDNNLETKEEFRL